jgi:putative transcription factor
MAGCDLCGKEPTIGIVELEGARMNVCAGCASYGKEISRSDRPKGPDPWTIGRARTQGSSARPEAQVRPDLPRILRKAREQAKKTQEEFANHLGVKLSQYHQYESGASLPDIETAKRIGRVLNEHLVGLLPQNDTAGPTSAQPTGPLTVGDLLKKR